MKPESINVQCTKLQQGHRYTEVLALGPHKLRVDIRRDSYDFQSSAKIERWDGDQWREVHSLHYGAMATGRWAEVPSAFADDRNTLIKVATTIL